MPIDENDLQNFLWAAEKPPPQGYRKPSASLLTGWLNAAELSPEKANRARVRLAHRHHRHGYRMIHLAKCAAEYSKYQADSRKT